MTAFTYIVGFALVALSLGYAVSALPTPAILDVSIPAIVATDAVSCVFAKLILELEAKIRALAHCGTLAELEVALDVVAVLFRGCADELLKIGAGVAVTVEAKANIVACVAAIITLLVKVCLQVSIKFGIVVVASLFVKIDVALQLLLINLNICIDGIIALIAKALASVTVRILVQVHLKLCLGVLGLAGVTL